MKNYCETTVRTND